MSELIDARADAVVRSGFRALRAVYLLELERLEHGVPAGPLRLAAGLTSSSRQSRLFAVAKDPFFASWQQHAARVIVGDPTPQRQHVLQLAYEAQIGRHWRRAVQLHGWLMLTSTRVDDPLGWAVWNLRSLRRDVYHRSV